MAICKHHCLDADVECMLEENHADKHSGIVDGNIVMWFNAIRSIEDLLEDVRWIREQIKEVRLYYGDNQDQAGKEKDGQGQAQGTT